MPEHPNTQDVLSRCLPGKFVAFEGADGSGKSTQIRRFVGYCEQRGIPFIEVREPGGTPIGERIREVLLDKEHQDMSLACEMLLYMASRAQLVEKRIRPALAEGRLVVADRFVSSTLAYQGAAGGLPLDQIDAVARVAVGATMPDLVVVFDVDERTAAKRAGISAKKSGSGEATLFAPDRMEDRDREFRRKVRKGYLDQVKADPRRHLLVSGGNAPDEVWSDLLNGLAEKLAAPQGS